MGLGMEKLDRDAFDPEKVYDKVPHYSDPLRPRNIPLGESSVAYRSDTR